NHCTRSCRKYCTSGYRSHCYQRKSVIVTSQLPIAKWYDYINEPTLADAIMDRLLANATRIELKGDSMRRKNK
ncbi:MAG: ATP-binding protein, partial [Bacteroidia bacterium]|nr:ATP-binding protein [Bacteroidia bacterium]